MSSTSRRRLSLKSELALVFLPTATTLIVLGLVEAVSRERILFSSLASSAFLIYLDPGNEANQTKTLLISQLSAASLGLLAVLAFGPGFLAGALAMCASIVLMLALHRMHPPAVGTSLIFAFQSGKQSNLGLFALAAATTAGLALLQRAAAWALARAEAASPV
jgi:CBS-domain-containing membrane protein